MNREPDSGSTPPGCPALLVHGGAWNIPDDEAGAHLDGLHRALTVGRRLLERGRPALDVVVEVAEALEAHPAFDAGRGAVLDRDGLPQLDAGLMDGSTLRWAAVGNVRHLAHPIRAARHLLEDDGQARFLVGEGAERFAAEHGLAHVDPSALIVDRERRRYDALRSEAAAGAPRGTIGCVALDRDGRLAAATSTGGAPYARPGRVGDSPIVGAGYFADAHAAASSTGRGEAILTVGLAGRACDRVQAGASPQEAASGGLAAMQRTVGWLSPEDATGGLILLRRDGRGGWAFTTSRMARGGWVSGGDPWAAVAPP